MKRCLPLFFIVAAIFNYGCGSSDVTIDYFLEGSYWRQATASAEFPARRGTVCLKFNNALWVIGGNDESGSEAVYYNDVWKSNDGVSWMRITPDAGFSPRDGHSGVVFDGKMWIIGGKNASGEYLNDVWSSSDGGTWVEVTDNAGFPERFNHTSVTDGLGICVIAGRAETACLNDVWYSYNGKDWQEKTASAGFSRRQDHCSLYFNGALWVISGWDLVSFGPELSDVWKSTDAKNWIKVADGVFPARVGAAAVVADGRMWLLGGLLVNHVFGNDVWNSIDGATWTQVDASAHPFTPRSYHQAAYFNLSLWVIGGCPTSSSVLNDTWYSN